MKTLWKILQTTKFITTGYFNAIPQQPVFKLINRSKFNDHLILLKGVDSQSELWLDHLKNINYYCDSHNVELLEEEFKDISNVYNNNTNSNVHEVVGKEKALFEKHAKKFHVDSLNYDLRMYRPDACFLPNGKLRFEDKQ